MFMKHGKPSFVLHLIVRLGSLGFGFSSRLLSSWMPLIIITESSGTAANTFSIFIFIVFSFRFYAPRHDISRLQAALAFNTQRNLPILVRTECHRMLNPKETLQGQELLLREELHRQNQHRLQELDMGFYQMCLELLHRLP